ncbi:Ig-like domain-containing protein [Pantoea dispersa]|uniref:Ig-like domain-containing protein n=1 Tax=Pantoea dispersa TaxID=59814 RepID=UPI0021AEDCE0|nr:Ig-like domain-containing protein [Pantoea dispersa]MCT6590797.1 Ig-like domain-containing protein [Pantoea dispersa]MCW0322057.1 hypothetical protein [Pantoea dispersa]MCW0326909.1 hypothetical protein [Pantoea dispersa]MCW0433219.1 hypothetical protein [Pantoea dispersa]
MSTALTNAKQLWTTDPQRTFSGSAPSEAGGIMEIVMDSTVYTVTIAADGSWSWQPPFPLAEGPHNLSVRTIDRAGNVGAPSLFIVNVDLTAPDQPLIIGVDDNAGNKTGPVSSGQQTDDRTPTLKGVAEPDSIVRLYNAQNQLIGSVKASSNGYWEITPTLADGEHSLYVTATDGRGYVSRASETFTLTVADDSAVPVPGKVEITHAQDNAGAAQGKLLDGALTDDTTPTLRGTAPAGSNVLIQYRDVNGQWVDGGYATLSGTGWSWTPDKALGEGNWEFRAYAGSGWTDEFTLEIDLTPQSELSITHAWDDFGINTGLLHNGAITDDRTPALNGRAEANSIVYIHFRNVLGNWELLGSVQAGADGNWVYETDRLSPGSYQFSASDNDKTHNSSSDFALTIAADAGLAPQITSAFDNVGKVTGALKSGATTDDATPELRGVAEANSVVFIEYRSLNGNWNTGHSVKTDHTGNWSFIPEENLHSGSWQFIAKAGESGEQSLQFDLNIQPEAPVILGAFDDSLPSTGLIQHGGFTDDLTPILKGTGFPGQIITIEYGQFGDPWIAGGTAVVDKDGNWSWQSPALKEQTGWEFRASNSGQTGTPKWSNTFAINVTDSGKESQGYLWDFNDGTLQGWKAAGKYGQSGELTVKKWSGNGTNQLGSMTNGTTDGYNGEVAYRTIIVEKGKTYEVSYDALQHTSGGDYKSKLGMSIDGKSVIPETLQKTSWTHYTGYYTATETKKVKVAITNGTSSRNGNDFAIDNIGIKPVEQKTDNHLADMKTSNEVIGLSGEQSSFDLANLLTEKGTVKTINMSDKIDNDLLVDVKTILQHGEMNLFIENSNTQMKVNGDIGDVVKLKDLMPDSQDSVSWIQQNGNVTIAGVHYSVYNHGDAELLVQEGVKVELV